MLSNNKRALVIITIEIYYNDNQQRIVNRLLLLKNY